MWAEIVIYLGLGEYLLNRVGIDKAAASWFICKKLIEYKKKKLIDKELKFLEEKAREPFGEYYGDIPIHIIEYVVGLSKPLYSNDGSIVKLPLNLEELKDEKASDDLRKLVISDISGHAVRSCKTKIGNNESEALMAILQIKAANNCKKFGLIGENVANDFISILYDDDDLASLDSAIERRRKQGKPLLEKFIKTLPEGDKKNRLNYETELFLPFIEEDLKRLDNESEQTEEIRLYKEKIKKDAPESPKKTYTYLLNTLEKLINSNSMVPSPDLDPADERTIEILKAIKVEDSAPPEHRVKGAQYGPTHSINTNPLSQQATTLLSNLKAHLLKTGKIDGYIVKFKYEKIYISIFNRPGATIKNIRADTNEKVNRSTTYIYPLQFLKNNIVHRLRESRYLMYYVQFSMKDILENYQILGNREIIMAGEILKESNNIGSYTVQSLFSDNLSIRLVTLEKIAPGEKTIFGKLISKDSKLDKIQVPYIIIDYIPTDEDFGVGY